jgi:hypothetical protein
MTDAELEKLYNNFLEFTDHMVCQYDHMAVAGVMMAQALSIYRTGMNEEDYNKMVDSISSMRNQIKKFEKPILQ